MNLGKPSKQTDTVCTSVPQGEWKTKDPKTPAGTCDSVGTDSLTSRFVVKTHEQLKPEFIQTLGTNPGTVLCVSFYQKFCFPLFPWDCISDTVDRWLHRIIPGRHRESYLTKSHTGTKKMILFLNYINVKREGQKTIWNWLQISSRFRGFSSGSQRRVPSQTR